MQTPLGDVFCGKKIKPKSSMDLQRLFCFDEVFQRKSIQLIEDSVLELLLLLMRPASGDLGFKINNHRRAWMARRKRV
jgi:hypothetical protein